ncbi:MAG: ATP-dependent Clp protease ATP-binding subunit [Bacillota bacterium]|nr:ATP-dependent Clp protease ATP-binding subunit [Bacillota bacterium]MDW7683389.1 ATP-dependent Clp protease ATP-binding subunit [Bacillota bacterium]
MFMFGRFTERAQKVLVLAQDEAKRFSHSFVGTEHILLGLVREGEGIAAKVLLTMGVELDSVRLEIEKLIGKGDQRSVPQGVNYTPRAKKVIELAIEEGQSLGHNYVGTEHLLLGLIREGEGIAAQVLANLGVDLARTRKSVLALLGGEDEPLPDENGKAVSSTPTVDQFGRDLTKLAKEGKLDPVIGRDTEIERVIQVLSRRTKNNPCLIGEPGVGKTAIAEGLAQRIVEGKVPETLKEKRVATLELAAVVAGTKYRGEFEERLRKLMEELRTAGNVIVFIDELHTLIGAGAAEGAIDASNILKPALARGELQAIGATTLDEYRKYIERDPALERRFQPITVGEPTKEESEEILKGLRDRYEAHHRVKITDEALKAAVTLADRYITDRFLPDKAIDLIDEAASRVRMTAYTAPPDLKELEERLETLRNEKESAVRGQEFEAAAKLRDKEQQLKQELQNLKREWEQRKVTDTQSVTAEDIAQIVSAWTGIPVKRLSEGETERLLNMESILHERVIGQDEAVKAVSRAIRRARAGLKDPKRPIGSFIFLGPTGVGKTELARALAESLFGDEDAMVRLDMSEYMEKHTTSRLVGSPPGYVGYEEGGQLTEKVRRKPYSVLLFDEIEKAHPEVFNVLLQVLEDGRLTDGKGRMVDFRNTVIIMTSNVGAGELKKQATMGFRSGSDREKTYEDMKNKVMDELKRTFRPEFLNRLDEVIVFHPLEEEHLGKIVDLMLRELGKRLSDYEIHLDVSDDAKAFLAQEGYDPTYGARPLRRALQKRIEDEVSERMLRGEFTHNDTILVTVENEKLVFKKTESAGTRE